MTDSPDRRHDPRRDPASAVPESDLKDRIARQHLKNLYASARLSQAGALLLGALALVLARIYARTPTLLLAFWGLALLLGILIRLALARRQRLAPPEGRRDLRTWQRRTMLALAVSGTVWGLYPWLTPPGADRYFESAAALLLVTVSGAALVLISAHRRYYLSFSIPLFLLTIARVLFVPPRDHLLALLLLMAFVTLERAADRARGLLGSLVGRGEHNARLIEALREQERLLADEHTRLRRLVESLPVPVAYCDADFVLRHCNPSFESTFLPPDFDPRGRPLADLLGRRRSEALEHHGREALAGENRTFEMNLPCRTPRGIRARTFRISLVPDTRREEEDIAGLYIHLFDVTVYKKAEARLSAQALRDDLTGLYNRRGFEQFLAQILSHDHTAVHSIIYLDLDRLKEINDRFGHEAGDLALRTFAHRLARAVRREDLCARLGGDEFAVFLRNCPIDCAERVSRSVRASLDRPLVYRNAILPLHASIGGVSFVARSVTFQSAIAEADRCMYEAKHREQPVLRTLGPERTDT